MAMLNRYKKQGGFLQLLQLLESFAPAKQDKFLAMIEEENPIWAKALREKLITIHRVFSWPTSFLAELVPHLPLTVLAAALHGLSEEQKAHLFSGLPSGERRKIETEFESLSPKEGEISATHFKIVETVRRLTDDGILRIDQFDAGVLIDEDFENRILQSATYVSGGMQRDMDSGDDSASESNDEPSLAATVSTIGARSAPSSGGLNQSADLKAVQALLLNLQKENKALKTEVKVLKEKLEKIRRIA